MRNEGNVSGMVYTSYPPQWDEVWVCDDCMVKKTERVHGALFEKTDLSKYKEVSDA